jgi:hypothetical protein
MIRRSIGYEPPQSLPTEGALPAAVRVRGYRLAALVVSVLFFGFFSALVIMDQVGELLG